jgi:hypothetical protein
MYILSFYPKGQLNMTKFNTDRKEGSNQCSVGSVIFLRIRIHGSVILLYGEPDPGGRLITDPQKIDGQKKIINHDNL